MRIQRAVGPLQSGATNPIHELFEAKVRYLMSRLRLASSVGSLGDDDIRLVNEYLGPELVVSN